MRKIRREEVGGFSGLLKPLYLDLQLPALTVGVTVCRASAKGTRAELTGVREPLHTADLYEEFTKAPVVLDVFHAGRTTFFGCSSTSTATTTCEDGQQ